MKIDNFSVQNLKFTFIIPVFNEEEFIGICLNSILSQSSAVSDCEIIVVDNGSSDRSREIIKKYPQAQLVIAPNCNVGEVRNIGAKAATGSHLIFIDGDCQVPENFVTRVSKLVKKSPKNVFGGGILLPSNPNWLEKYWTLQSETKSQLPKKLIGASIVICKDIFFEVEGFREDISSGEDGDLHDKIVEKGMPLAIINDLDVVHLGNAKTITSFIKRQSWHSENYTKNIKKSVKDPIFIIVALTSLISTWIIFAMIFTLHIPVMELSMLALAPLVLSIKRIYRSQKSAKLFKNLPIIYFIDALYIVGRCYGLVTGTIQQFRKNQITEGKY